MKAICSKHDLIDAINIVQKAVMSKASLPVLEGILIEADEMIKLTGNSFELGVECYVKSDIIDKGSIVINSRMFGEIIRRLPETEILLEVKDNYVVLIECENSHFEIKGMDASGFPILPQIQEENVILLPQEILKNLIRQTLFSVGFDDNRPVLTGSLMEVSEGDIKLVSIDGFRMALRKVISTTDNDFNVIIPGKNLNEIVKILQSSGDVSIFSSDNQIVFSLDNCRIVSKLLDGEFMNYKSLIPDQFTASVVIDTKELLESIERASLITHEDKRYPVKFIINDQDLLLTSNTELGSVKEKLVVDHDGEDIEIGFNPRYFIEALRVIDVDEIKISFTSQIGPCVISSVNGDNFIYMILPVRIKS